MTEPPSGRPLQYRPEPVVSAIVALRDDRNRGALRGEIPKCSALPKPKAISLPNPRSLVGVPVLFLVRKYITKEGRKKITHVPSALGFSRCCEIGDITIFFHSY